MPSNYGHKDYGELLYSYLGPLDFVGAITIPWTLIGQLNTAGTKRFEGAINFQAILAGSLGITYKFQNTIDVFIDFSDGGLEIYLGPFWKPDVPIDEFWVPDVPPSSEFWVPDVPMNNSWVPIAASSEFWVPDVPVRPVWETAVQERPGG
jgi:hypothetical protein